MQRHRPAVMGTLLLVLCAALASGACTYFFGGPKVPVTGRIVGADGQPVQLAQVHVPPGGKKPDWKLVSVQAEADGTFEIKVPAGRPVTLEFTAVDHVRARIPVFLEEGGEVGASVEVTLERNPWAESFEEVKIIGDWSDYGFDSGEPMELQDDGTFVWEGTTEEDEVGYQLLGTVTHGHSVNGTMSERYEYDGGGDYRSFVSASEGKVRIVFDPSLLAHHESEGLPKVAWDAAHSHLDDFHGLERETRETVSAYHLALAAQEELEEEGAADGAVFDLDPLLTQLRTSAREGGHPSLRAFAAIQLVQVSSRTGTDLADGDGELILKAAPASSIMWKLNPYGAGELISMLEESQRDQVLESFLTENPDRVVRGQALAWMTSEARDSGDEERWRELYRRLESKFGSEGSLRYEVVKLNPDKRIAVDKPVPAFELALMGGGTVSNEDLGGTYYLLDFWATWCGPCVGELPNLDEAYEKFGDRDLVFISLSFDGEPEDVDRFREGEWKMPWKHVFVEDGFKSELAETFEVLGIPEPILVGPDGTILATEPETRGKTLLETLEKHLGGSEVAEIAETTGA